MQIPKYLYLFALFLALFVTTFRCSAEESAQNDFYYRVAQVLLDTAEGRQSSDLTVTDAELRRVIGRETLFTKMLHKSFGEALKGSYEVTIGTNSNHLKSYWKKGKLSTLPNATLWQRGSKKNGKLKVEFRIEQRKEPVGLHLQNKYSSFKEGKQDIIERFKLFLANAESMNLFVSGKEIPSGTILESKMTSYGFSRSNPDASIKSSNQVSRQALDSDQYQNSRKLREYKRKKKAYDKAKAKAENYVAGWNIHTKQGTVTVHDDGSVDFKAK